MIVVYYPGIFDRRNGTRSRRAFTTSERATQWAIQSGYGGRATMQADATVRLTRCRAWSARVPLFPVTTYSVGEFINDLHYRECLKHWTGYAGGPDKMRYVYDDVTDEEFDPAQAFEVSDHTGYMTHLSRTEFIGRADRTADLCFSS